MKKGNKYSYLVLVLLGTYLFLALSNHIALSVGELGYLLKEGKWFWESGQIAFTNLHSYTAVDFAISNNHWGAAAVFYGIQQLIGFGGLHFLIAACYTAVFLALYQELYQKTSLFWSIAIGILAVPLFAMHNLVDAIFFTYIFTSVYWILLHKVLQQKIKVNWLLVLPLLQVVWVNSHEYFWIGWCLLFIASMCALLIKSKSTTLLIGTTMVSLLLSLVHPKGWQGVYTALQNSWESPVFMPIWEQPTWDAYLLTYSYSLLYVIAVVLVSSLFLILIIKKNMPQKIWLYTTGGSFLLLTLWTNQLAPLLVIPFLLSAFRVVTYFYAEEAEEQLALLKYKPPVLSLYILVPTFVAAGFYQPITNFGYGIQQEEVELVEFVNAAKIEGPVFNNTAISGLLAYGLEMPAPTYISSQPQAHPNEFYNQYYFPTILNPLGWKKVHDLYEFNTIIFRLKGASTEQLEFMGNLLGNGKWAMVYYVPDYEVVLVKKNEKNQSIIDRFRIKPNVQENSE